MKQETLKRIRLFVPAIIAFILSYYYYTTIRGMSFSGMELTDYVLLLIVSISIGLIYNLLNLRTVITQYKYNMVELKVKRTIFNLYTDNVSEKQKQYLFKNDRLKLIYYDLIDDDDFLEKKKKSISFKVLIWSSTADLGIISFICSIAFFISIFFLPEMSNELIRIGLGMMLLSILTLVSHNFSFLKLIKLSNDQLTYIETHQINKLDQLIKDALKNSSKEED